MAERAVQTALRLGATEAEAYLKSARTTQVEFTDTVDNTKTNELSGIGIRVALGKKTAIYSTSILDDAEVDRAAGVAVKIARVAPEDPHWQRMNDEFGHAPAKGFYDEAVEKLQIEDVVERLTLAIDRIRDFDERVRPSQGSLAMTVSSVFIANDHGTSHELRDTRFRYSIRATADEGGLKSSGSAGQEARFWRDIDFEGQALEAARKARDFLRSDSIPSCKTSIIVRNRIFAGILGVMLSDPINGGWVTTGRSPLSGKLGVRLAPEQVSITDDGLMNGGWQTKPFDDEGHPTQRTPIIQNGILKGFLHNVYTALQMNVDSTGNAQRPSYSAAPEPAPNNLILEPGKLSKEEIIRETKEGIFVEETIGEWLSNPINGSLTATVTHGYLVENGDLTKPVKEVIFSGDFYKILEGGIDALGKDLANYENCYSPTVKLANLTIIGKR